MNDSNEPYFAREVLEKALSLHAQSYELLLWMAELERRDASGAANHEFSRLQDASLHWIQKNYDVLPAAARPDREDLEAFANLFATYLESSFDLVESPGQRLYSDGGHCFCSMCSWMADMPNLQPKKVTPFDKRRAKNLQREFIHNLASTRGLECDAACERVLADSSLREDIALGTWTAQLLRRLQGVTPGPAILVLWRWFAWTSTGSPKKQFRVTPDLVEASILRLEAALGESHRSR